MNRADYALIAITIVASMLVLVPFVTQNVEGQVFQNATIPFTYSNNGTTIDQPAFINATGTWLISDYMENEYQPYIAPAQSVEPSFVSTTFQSLPFQPLPFTPITEINEYENTIRTGQLEYTVETHQQYLEDYDGSWIPYRLTDDTNFAQVEVAEGKLVFDKINGAVTMYSGDEVIIDSDSYQVRVAELGSDVWTALDVNNSPVTTTIIEDGDKIFVTFTRTNDEGTFNVEYLVRDGVKTTASFTNNVYDNHKFAFTETLNLVDNIIVLNDQEINLTDYIGQTFDRDTLVANQSLVLEAKGLFFNAGIGFDNLWSVGIFDNNRIALDYAHNGLGIVEVQTAIGETVELDPSVSLTNVSIFGVSGDVNIKKGAYNGGAASFGSCANTYSYDTWSMTGIGNGYCGRNIFAFDITSIDDGATITDVKLKSTKYYQYYHGDVTCKFMSVEGNVLTTASASASGLWTDSADGTAFLHDTGSSHTASSGNACVYDTGYGYGNRWAYDVVWDLGANADADLQAELSVDNEWGVGVYSPEAENHGAYPSNTGHMNTYSDTGYPLSLTVTYTIPADPPTSVTATNNPSDTGVVVSWTAPSSYVPDGYTVETSPDGTTWTVSATVSSSTTSTSFSGYALGDTQYFRVQAQSGSQASLYSTPVNSVVITNAPNAPTGLSTTDGLPIGTSWTSPEVSTNYKVHSFTTTGASTFEITAGSGDVEYLVVAGGGGGAGSHGGGGGAGGLLQNTVYKSTGSYTVTVGSGGTGTGTTIGGSGNDSTFDTITTTGGGGGSYWGGAVGGNGGSGGGGGSYTSTNGGGTGVSGQGNAGGNGGLPPLESAGGGGGAGSAGGDAASGISGDGGDGLELSFNGVATFYAAGGGGGENSGTAGIGGSGIGGDGSNGQSSTGGTGTTNTGSGGGGGGGGGTGGNGGSGIVIVRYLNDGSITATGGTVTSITESNGGNGGSAITGYKVYRTDSSLYQVELPNSSGSDSELTFTDNEFLLHGFETPAYKIHTFLSGTSSFAVTGSGTVEVLVVGSGGQGGRDDGGGGGAGGVVYMTNKEISSQTYSIVVGGTTTGSSTGIAGADTTALGLTAKGGGGGANWNTNPNVNGGSGGGGSSDGSKIGGTETQTSQSGDSGTYGFGNDGGTYSSTSPAGGGGGAFSAGQQGGNGGGVSGNGGDGIGGTNHAGINALLTASNQGVVESDGRYIAGGGGGSGNERSAGAISQGGLGGGADGVNDAGAGNNAVANTGSGGSGGGNIQGGDGGSGIVIIKYVDDGSITATGGTVTTITGTLADKSTNSVSITSTSGDFEDKLCVPLTTVGSGDMTFDGTSCTVTRNSGSGWDGVVYDPTTFHRSDGKSFEIEYDSSQQQIFGFRDSTPTSAYPNWQYSLYCGSSYCQFYYNQYNYGVCNGGTGMSYHYSYPADGDIIKMEMDSSGNVKTYKNGVLDCAFNGSNSPTAPNSNHYVWGAVPSAGTSDSAYNLETIVDTTPTSSVTGVIDTGVQNPDLSYTDTNLPDGTDHFSIGSWVKLDTSRDSTLDGTNTGATTAQTGKINNAWDFSASDYATISDDESLRGLSEMSLNFWVKANSISGVDFITSGTSAENFKVRMGTSGDTQMYVGGNTNAVWTSSGAITTSGFKMITIVFDGSGASNTDKVKMYVDGTLNVSNLAGTIPSSIPNNVKDIILAGDGANIILDEVVFYNKALTSTEVSALYNSGSGDSTPDTDGLVAHYNFEQTGTTLESQIQAPPANTKLLGLNDITFSVGATSASAGDGTYQYSGNIQSTTAGNTMSHSGQTAGLAEMYVDPSNTRLFGIFDGSNKVSKYTCTDAWALDGCSYSQSSNVMTDNNPFGLEFSDDGTKMWHVGSGVDYVYYHTLSTAWDLSTITYDVNSLSIASSSAHSTGFQWVNSGNQFMLGDQESIGGGIGTTHRTVYEEWGCTTPYDITTCSESESFTMALGQSQGNTMSPDGTVIIGSSGGVYQASTGDEIQRYDCSTGFDLSTCSATGSAVSFSSYSSNFNWCLVKDDGSKMLCVDNTGQNILSFTMPQGTANTIISATGLTDNTSTPQHYAFTRDSSNGWTIYQNGVSQATATDSTSLGGGTAQTTNIVATTNGLQGNSLSTGSACTTFDTFSGQGNGRVRLGASSSSENCDRLVLSFDTSSIPTGTTINSLTLNVDVLGVGSAPVVDIVPLNQDIATATPAQVASEFSNTALLTGQTAFQSTGSKSVTLGTADFTTNYSNGKYHIGILASPETRQSGVHKYFSQSGASLDVNYDANIYTTNISGMIDEFFINSDTLTSTEIAGIADRGATLTPLTTTGASTTTYGDSTVVAGSTYYYGIKAENAVGLSDYTTFVSGLSGNLANAPTNVVAINGVTQANVSWTASTDLGGLPLLAYKIYTNVDGGAWTFIQPSSLATTHTETNTVLGSTYGFKIVTVNAAGDSPESTPTYVVIGTVPDAPTGTTVTPLAGATHTIDWAAPTANGGFAVTGYEIERSTTSGSGFTTVGQVGNVLTWTDPSTTLTLGDTYYYRVLAINSQGLSAASNEGSGLTGDVPDAVANVTADAMVNYEINLNWTPANENFYALTTYEIFASENGGTPVSQGTVPQAQTTFLDQGLNSGSTYTYSVYATNSLGTSPISNQPSTTAGDIPGIPTNPTATVVVPSQIDVAWGASSPNGYAVTYTVSISSDGGATWFDLLNAVSPYQHSGLTNGQTYQYKISATNALGTSAYTAGVSGKAGDVPAVPTGLSVTPISATELTFAWGVPNDNGYTLTGYKVERSIDNITFTVIDPNFQSNVYQDTGLTTSTAYYYKVSAINGLGTSAPSNSANGQTFGVPNPITTLSLTTISTSQIDLTWSQPSLNGFAFVDYTIERSFDGLVWQPHATTTNTNYQDTLNTNDNTEYHYRVYTQNSFGTSLAGNAEMSFTTPTPPAAVTTTVQSDTQIDLIWNNPTGTAHTGFLIEQSIDAGSTWTTVTTTTNQNLAYSVINLTPLTDYQFRVSTVNQMLPQATGTSVPSPVATATTFGAPDVPTGLTATALPGSQIQLDWVAPTNVNGSPVTEYKIERSTDGGVTWGPLVANTGNLNITYTDTGLTTTQEYHYRVSAYNIYGVSSPGTEASAIASDVPSQVTGLTATPTINYTIDLSWTTPNGNGYAVSGYMIERNIAGAGWVPIVPDTASVATTYADINLSASTVYEYRVSAINVVGTGAVSSIVASNAGDVPGSPVLTLTALPNSIIQLDWTVPSDNGFAITTYAVEKSIDGTNWSPLTSVNAITYQDTGLTNGSTYYYKVTAVNQVGNSVFSSAVSIIAGDTPGALGALTAITQSDTSVQLTWTPATANGYAVTGYKVEQSLDGVAFTDVTLNTQSTAVSYTVTGLTDSTDYYFKVTGINALGLGALGPIASAHTFGAPDPFIPFTTSSTTTSATVNWSAPYDHGSSITSYRVEILNLVNGVGNGQWLTLTTTGGLTNTHTGLQTNTEYQYRIVATNSYGSVTSPAQAITTFANPPALTATASSGTAIDLTWPAVSGSTTYSVYSSANDVTFTLLQSGISATTYQATGLSLGQTVYYKVTVTNAAGESTQSASATATTWSLPGTPTGLTITNPTPTTARFTWTAPTDFGGAPSVTYTLQRSEDNSNWISYLPSTTTTIDDNSLTLGQQYYWRVNSVTAAGVSGNSNTVSYLTPTLPTAPGSLTAALTGANNNAAVLNWVAPSSTSGYVIIGYHIETNVDGNGWTDLVIDTGNSGLVYTNTGLSAGSSYVYRVSAITAVGEGVPSNTATVNPILVSLSITGTSTGGNSVSVSPTITTSGASSATIVQQALYRDNVRVDLVSLNIPLTSGASLPSMIDYPTQTSSYVMTIVLDTGYVIQSQTNPPLSLTPSSPFTGDISFSEDRTEYDVDADCVAAGGQWDINKPVASAGTPQADTAFKCTKSYTESVLEFTVQPVGAEVIISYQPQNINEPAIVKAFTATSSQISETTELDRETDYYGSIIVNPTFEYTKNADQTITVICDPNDIMCQPGDQVPKGVPSEKTFKSFKAPSSVAQLGIEPMGNLFGVNMVFIFVIAIAGIFTGRSAPMGVVFIVITLGIMAYLGYLDFGSDAMNTATWALLIVSAILGIFLGKRWS